MLFRQYYLSCLAHASYLIADKGEAAVVDPQRDVDQYLADLSEHDLKLRYILETHFHADFVSGHHELAKRTGAEIVFGTRAGEASFEFRRAADGDVLRVGNVQIHVLETPGHTPESVSFLVKAITEPNEPDRLLSGDTLFIGEVGRPDLVGARGFSAEEMAGMLYDSLREKIMSLPAPTMVYPAHGAGSLCGKNISTDTFSTIGEQLRTNYALQDMTRDDFVTMATDELPEVPDYFPRAVAANHDQIPELDDVQPGAQLSPSEFRTLMAEPNTLVLDVRESFLYGAGHIAGSVSIPLGGQFAIWAGAFVSPDVLTLIVAHDEDEVHEAVMRMARIGLHPETQWLAGGIQSWDDAGFELGMLEHIDVNEAAVLIDKGCRVIDVRRPGEFDCGHIKGSQLISLDRLLQAAADLEDKSTPTIVVCRTGYRSTIGCSLLQARGFTNLYNLVGGFTAWSQHATSAGV